MVLGLGSRMVSVVGAVLLLVLRMPSLPMIEEAGTLSSSLWVWLCLM